MKVWLTKYALTQGIIQVDDAKVCSDISDKMISWGCMNTAHKPYWYTTLDEAKEHAEKMRVAKIKSLKKSLAKYQELRF